MDKITNLKGKLQIMDNLLEDISEIETSCFICLSKNIKEGYCSDCNYDFSNIFVCPITDNSTIRVDKIKYCVITKQVCPYKSLEYEVCDVYHDKGN